MWEPERKKFNKIIFTNNLPYSPSTILSFLSPIISASCPSHFRDTGDWRPANTTLTMKFAKLSLVGIKDQRIARFPVSINTQLTKQTKDVSLIDWEDAFIRFVLSQKLVVDITHGDCKKVSCFYQQRYLNWELRLQIHANKYGVRGMEEIFRFWEDWGNTINSGEGFPSWFASCFRWHVVSC